MSPVRTKNLAVAGAVAATVLAGGATMAAAASGTPSPPDTTASQQDTSGTSEAPGTETPDANEGPEGQDEAAEGPESNDPSYTGSVKAPADGQDDETGGKDDEAADAARLAPLATVDEAAAQDAATAAVPGTVGTTSLDDENGYVVWSVQVTQADGTVVDVKVDAGNGSVLAQDTGEGSQTAGE